MDFEYLALLGSFSICHGQMLDEINLTSITSAADLYAKLNLAMGIDSELNYYDRKSNLSPEEYKNTLATSTSIYVGNLPPFTFESTLVAYFGNIYPP